MPDTRSTNLTAVPIRGLDERHIPPRPDHAAIMHGLIWDREVGWRTGPGYRQAVVDHVEGSSPFSTEAAIHSLHYLSTNNHRVQWVIWETDTGQLRFFYGTNANAPGQNLKDINEVEFNGSGGRSRAVHNGPWIGSQSQAWGANLYIVNGTDEPIVFDGRRVDRAGFSTSPGPPDVVLSDKTGGNIPPNVTGNDRGVGYRSKEFGYRYKVSFINRRGQESPTSPPSDLITATNPGNARRVPVLALPLGDASVVARRIYRTADIIGADGEPVSRGMGEVYYLLAEIPDNVTINWTDINPDANLGGVLDESYLGPWPEAISMLAAFKGTMFAASHNHATVHYSRPRQPEVYPADNTFDLSDNVGGGVTGMYATDNALVIFKRRGIYLIKGDPSQGFYSQTLTRDYGCAAANTIRAIPQLGLAFLAEDGVYLLKGALENVGAATEVIPLSTPIHKQIKRLNTAALANARAAVWHRHRCYWLSVPTLGDDRPDEVWWFFYEVGAWSTDTNWPVGAILETADHRGELYFGSWDTTNAPGLHIISTGFPDKKGKQGAAATPNAPRFLSVPIDFGRQYRGVQIVGLTVTARSYGTNRLTADLYLNRSPTSVYDDADDNNSIQQLYLTDTESLDEDAPVLPVYGQHTFDDVTIWAEHRPVVLRYDLSTIDQPPVMEAQVDLQPVGQRTLIIGYSLEVLHGTKTALLPLSEFMGTP
jgi:hypothetical protein